MDITSHSSGPSSPNLRVRILARLGTRVGTRLAALVAWSLLAPLLACGGTAPVTPTPASSTGPGTGATGTSGAVSCAPAQRMPDLGRDHIQSLTYAYPQHPATSGPHYPVWLMPPPQVFSTAVPETRVVHNLEHGYIAVYYAEGSETPADTVAALAARVSGQRKVLMAPYTGLPSGQILAFAAWDELQLCPAGVSVDGARNALDRFITAFREGPLAPEALAG